MRGGFRRLLHPATVVTAIDLTETRAERDGLRAALHHRQELLDQLLGQDTPEATQAPGTTT